MQQEKKWSPQIVARFREKILFDKRRGSRWEQFKLNEVNGFNCRENEAGCRSDEGNHNFIRFRRWSANKETEKINFSTYNKKSVWLSSLFFQLLVVEARY